MLDLTVQKPKDEPHANCNILIVLELVNPNRTASQLSLTHWPESLQRCAAFVPDLAIC